MMKKCSFCAEEFEATSNRQKYCPKSHLAKCSECEVEFSISVAKIRTSELRCSSCLKKAGHRKQSSTMKKKFRSGELEGFRNPEVRDQAKKAIMEKYGVENISHHEETRVKRKKTFEDKYGGSSSFSSPEIQDKIRETNLEKYGAENPFGSKKIQKKIKETNLEKYGVENPLSSEKIQDQIRETNLDRYGVEHPLQNKDILEKAKLTLEKRYQVSNPGQIAEVRLRTQDRLNLVSDEDFRNYIISQEIKPSIEELRMILGYENSSPIYKRLKKLGLKDFVNYQISTPNSYWRSLIQDTLGIALEHEGAIFGEKNLWRCDLFSEEHKVGIDINPTISHSTQITGHPFYRSKTTTYHRERAIEAEKNGWVLYQIYDWTDQHQALSQLRNLFGLNVEKYYARDTSLVRPSSKEVSDFLDREHLSGSKAIGGIFYGLEHQGNLVQVMTFSKERFVKSEDSDSYEIIRLASRGSVVGGASKLFKKFVEDYSPNRVKSFSNLDTGHGKVYERLGFQYEGLSGLNALYSKPGTSEAFKVTTIAHKFKNEYERLGQTQKEYMNSLGFYRINDSGSKIFIWTKSV